MKIAFKGEGVPNRPRKRKLRASLPIVVVVLLVWIKAYRWGLFPEQAFTVLVVSFIAGALVGYLYRYFPSDKFYGHH